MNDKIPVKKIWTTRIKENKGRVRPKEDCDDSVEKEVKVRYSDKKQ